MAALAHCFQEKVEENIGPGLGGEGLLTEHRIIVGTIFFLAILVTFTAANLLWWRWVDRRMRSWAGSRAWRVVLACFVVGMLVYVAGVGTMVTARWLPMPIHVFAYLWNILVLPVSLVCMGVVALGVWGWKSMNPSKAGNPAAGAAAWRALPTRRRVLGMAGAVVPPLVALGLTGVAEAELGTFRIRRIALPVAGLPGDLEGMTITQVTDVHIGRFLPSGTLPKILDAVRGLNADVVVFTGDVLDASQRDIGPAIEFLQDLRPTDGRPYAIVEGNHDVAHGAEWFESMVLGAGLPLLLDSSIVMRVPGWGAHRAGQRRFGWAGSRGGNWCRGESWDSSARPVGA
jgi:hypothetical protein